MKIILSNFRIFLCLIFLIHQSKIGISQPGSLDLSFDPGSGTPTYVWASCVQPDGKILIGGNFTSYNGVSVNRIVRLNSNGSIDPSFNVGTGASWDVKSIVLQPDGKILVGGWFTSFNSVNKRGVVRLNSDGSVDMTFNSTGQGTNADVEVCVLQSDGKILVGGWFTTYNGTTRNRILRLNSDGSLDLTFGCVSPNAVVNTIALQSDGKIIFGGAFTSITSCSGVYSINRLTRSNPDGSLDLYFNQNGDGPNGVINAIAVQQDGKIIIGGQFTRYNLTGQIGVARLQPNGAGDLGTFHTSGVGFNSMAGVNTILLQPDGYIFLGGGFLTYDGVSRSNLIRLSPSGTVDLSFNPGTGANQQIYTSTLQPDGKIIIGGNFTAYNNIGRNRVARINANCTLQNTFNPLSDTTQICGISASLDAGSGYSSFSWNTGSNTQIVTATISGFYKVTVTNADGCVASDSTILSLVKANILNNDTSICNLSSITLSIDSLFPGKSLCSSNLLTSSLRNGLIGYWPFCGNANDASGNSNNGITSGTILTTDRFNGTSRAFYFSGSSYITVPDNAILRPSNMTVSAWVKMEPSAPQGAFIVSKVKTGDVSSGLFNMQIWDQNRFVSAFHNAGNCNAGDANWQFINLITSNILNRWVNIVTTYSNDSIRTYLNGQFYNSVVSNRTNLDNCIGSTLNIGKWWDGDPRFFVGKIDDIMMWNRALSQSEISQLYTPAYSVLWSTGATTNTITVFPTQSTTYYVTVSDGITTCTDSIRVNIATVDTSIAALDPPQVCTNSGQVRLQAGVASVYQWQSSANGVNFTNIAGATNRIYTATTTGYYRVKVTNTINCLDSSRAIQVTLNPQPTVNFTTNNTSQCINGNSFVFTNTTSISSGTLTYLWKFGDGNTATTTNATHTYAAPGTYTVKLIATSGNGCIDSTSQNVTINVKPTPDFTVNNAGQCLQGNNFVFTNTSSISSGSITYLWNFGDGGSATTLSASHSYTVAGNYQVKLITTSNNGCVDSITRNVVVYAQPSGLISTPSSTIICQGSSVTLTVSGGNTYQWLLGGVIIPGATGPSHTATQPGQYSVQIISSNNCQSTSTNTITLSLVQKPTPDFSFSGSCAGFSTLFNNSSITSSSGVVTYAWNFGDGSTSTLISPSHIYTNTGSFTASLLVTPVACPSLSASVSKPITIVAPPANQRYTTLNAVSGRNLQLQSRTFASASYLWQPNTGLNSSTISNPIFNHIREQEYKINISTIEGCIVVDTLQVRIFREKEIYVPKGFTPNGDVSNDLLIPRLVGIEQLIYFKVFDRWGQLMYQTTRAGEGWDGTFKGVKQPMESYTWIAEGRDIDGQIIKRTGATILLR